MIITKKSMLYERLPHLVLPLLVCLLVLGGCHGYPSGAPDAVCDTLQPSVDVNHHGQKQTTESPYTLTLSANSVEAGDTLTVTVSGAEGLNLRGIFLQVRKSGSTTALGSFTSFDDTNYQTRECSSTANSGVTHKNRDDKPVPQTFTWMAPADLSGDVQFVATVVQTQDTYWTDIMSSAVTVTADDAETTTTSGSAKQCLAASMMLAPIMWGLH